MVNILHTLLPNENNELTSRADFSLRGNDFDDFDKATLELLFMVIFGQVNRIGEGVTSSDLMQYMEKLNKKYRAIRTWHGFISL